jgi:predicted TIM-barrel fold metal-dependent hydrolase
MNSRHCFLSPPVAAGAALAVMAGWLLWAKVEPGETRAIGDLWRKERRIVDLHMHIDAAPERFDRAVRIMDRSGIGIGVNLSGGTVTRKDGGTSFFQRVKELADSRYPGRFVHYMNLDYAGWDDPGFGEKAAAQVVEGRRLGAAGLKEYKRLGLYLKDAKGSLIRIDDPKLDAVWAKCGELGMPVSIHVADPRAFWLPRDEKNERWKELKDHPDWWFGNPEKFPPREELLAALNRVIERHPKTTFVCVHFANNSEDIAWVDRMLDEHPNMMADLAARIPEIGRHAPEEVRRVFTKHADRILFASDFMVYERLILGSAGDDERPTDDDGVTFFDKCWRWMETNDRDWPHMTPIQGDWTISSIGLSPEVCRKIYFDNAARLLARSMPLPVMKAARVDSDFKPDGKFDEAVWAKAAPARLEYQSSDASAQPALSTAVHALWSDAFLYLAYECPFTTLTTFSPVQPGERVGLWDRDVVEAFIGSDPSVPGKYTEHEWAPNGEQLDLSVSPDKKDFTWSSGMESAVTVDEAAKVWRAEVRIPMKSLSAAPPQKGTRWRLNLYRHDAAGKAGLAFSPTLTGTFHTPERFGWLEFTAP